eukprot:51293-Amphidinium_carterae.1
MTRGVIRGVCGLVNGASLNALRAVPDVLVQNIVQHLAMSPRDVAAHRVQQLRALLEFYDCPDLGVVDLVARGLDLTGVPEHSRVLER